MSYSNTTLQTLKSNQLAKYYHLLKISIHWAVIKTFFSFARKYVGGHNFIPFQVLGVEKNEDDIKSAQQRTCNGSVDRN